MVGALLVIMQLDMFWGSGNLVGEGRPARLDQSHRRGKRDARLFISLEGASFVRPFKTCKSDFAFVNTVQELLC